MISMYSTLLNFTKQVMILPKIISQLVKWVAKFFLKYSIYDEDLHNSHQICTPVFGVQSSWESKMGSQMNKKEFQ